MTSSTIHPAGSAGTLLTCIVVVFHFLDFASSVRRRQPVGDPEIIAGGIHSLDNLPGEIDRQAVEPDLALPRLYRIGEGAQTPHLAWIKTYPMSSFKFEKGGGHSVGAMTPRVHTSVDRPASSTGDYWFGTTPANESKPCRGPPANTRYIVTTLSGCVEFELCNAALEGTGEKIVVRPGDLLLAEDSKGPAHAWRIVQCGLKADTLAPWNRMYLDISNNETYNAFLQDVLGDEV